LRVNFIRWGAQGCTPLYGLYRYVRPQRAAHPYPIFLGVPPPPGGGGLLEENLPCTDSPSYLKRLSEKFELDIVRM